MRKLVSFTDFVNHTLEIVITNSKQSSTTEIRAVILLRQNSH